MIRPEEIVTVPFIRNEVHGKVSLEYFTRKYACYGTNWGDKPTDNEVARYLESAENQLLEALTNEKLSEIKTVFKTKKALEKALWTPLTAHLVSQFDLRMKRFKYLVTRIHVLAIQNFENK